MDATIPATATADSMLTCALSLRDAYANLLTPTAALLGRVQTSLAHPETGSTRKSDKEVVEDYAALGHNVLVRIKALKRLLKRDEVETSRLVPTALSNVSLSTRTP